MKAVLCLPTHTMVLISQLVKRAPARWLAHFIHRWSTAWGFHRAGILKLRQGNCTRRAWRPLLRQVARPAHRLQWLLHQLYRGWSGWHGQAANIARKDGAFFKVGFSLRKQYKVYPKGFWIIIQFGWACASIHLHSRLIFDANWSIRQRMKYKI